MTLYEESQAKAILSDFKTWRLDISFANNIEICHLCFANFKRPSEYLNILTVQSLILTIHCHNFEVRVWKKTVPFVRTNFMVFH